MSSISTNTVVAYIWLDGVSNGIPCNSSTSWKLKDAADMHVVFVKDIEKQ